MTAVVATDAPRVSPAALAQRVDQQVHRHHAGAHPVLLVAAQPVWPHEPTLTTAEGRTVRVVPCRSPLAIWEQLTRPRDTTLVLLTDLAERELGAGILSAVFRQRTLTVEMWDLVAAAFGAQHLDPGLRALPWASEALLDAMPPPGWPTLAGTVLGRDHALRHLAAARLGLGRLGLDPDDLDVRALLRWSRLPAAAESLTGLRKAERVGLVGWLAEAYGRPARLLFSLAEAGHLADALPLALVCQAAWSADDPEALRAQGRIERYFGAGRLDPADVRAYAEAGAAVVADLVRPDADLDDRPTGAAVLERAEELLVQLGAEAAARHSTLLRTGFDHRAGGVAEVLHSALADPAAEQTGAAEAALAQWSQHHLARSQPHRVERARMALRLVRWLATSPADPAGVADGVARQIEDGGWVDLALAHVWAGEDTHPGLKRAFRAIHDRVAARRRELDRSFAGQLAAWVAADTQPGSMLTIEQVLDRVVAPVSERPVLLVVLDGMSAAVAADLAEDLARQHWLEHDPLAGQGQAHRRGVLAAVPSITAVSRTSLFAGALRRGDAAAERATFGTHPRWRGRPARLFHKRLIAGGAGEVLDPELEAALGQRDTLVAVVINTVDDALDHGRESAEPGWQVWQVGPLRTLLEHARYHERAVIITSDHGHVPDRDSVLRTVAEPASARHRSCPPPAGDGEVELAGPRVVADHQRVVALWDPAARYLPRRDGYHGGVALAEMTVPVLAFLPWNAEPPRGWVRLDDPRPAWWMAPPPAPPPVAAPVAQVAPRPRPARRPAPARAPAPAGEALFEVPAPRTQSLVDAVLDSEMFAAQHGLTPRKVPLPKIRGALTALVEANGVLPTATLAERAGERPERASGFVTTLQRIFNVDNYPVLSVVDEGRTVRLELPLLREQFGVGGAGS